MWINYISLIFVTIKVLLSESSYQDKIVDGIVKGINAYME